MGRQVVAALLEAPGAIGTVAGERLRALLKDFPNQVQADARPLLAHLDQEKQRQAEKLKKLEPLLRAGGDVGRGRNIFFGEKAACSSCHTIGLEGGHVGPDLTAVGAVRPGLDILEAVIFPNASFVPSMRSTVLRQRGRCTSECAERAPATPWSSSPGRATVPASLEKTSSPRNSRRCRSCRTASIKI